MADVKNLPADGRQEDPKADVLVFACCARMRGGNPGLWRGKNMFD
jgi:hypothetical protein